MSTDWKTGLWGCSDHVPSCLDTLFCPCCQTARQCQAANGNRDTSDFVQCILSTLLPCSTCQVRSKVVDKYRLDEGTLGTFLKGFLCFCCSVCQTHRELTLRGDYPGGAFYVKEPMSMN